MTQKTFHFTLGPVQGFVAQARRTRDFWAGSFLLSWLAGTAMQTVIAQGGKIIFPTPDKDYLNWLTGHGQGLRPRQGGIPNRFKAQVDGNFKPLLAEQAVRIAWRALAEAVWRKDLERHCQLYPATREIWDRQINGFWEIAWAIGDDDALLDRRKNWRTQLPPEEAGVKCSIMSGWQELSGAEHPGDRIFKDFWEELSQGGDFKRDLADDETLCAIALVKRRFPHCFEQVQLKEMPGDWGLHGWRVNPQTPSTLDLAAAKWLACVVRDQAEPLLNKLHEAAERLPFSPGDCGVNRLRCVKDAYRVRGLRHLNSSTLFNHVLENKKECSDQGAVREMKLAIKALQIKESPAPFYAILLMDGDSLGELLRKSGSAVSDALDHFTKQVPDIVYNHNGFLIYAGGDDVLGLLPLEDVLQCAADIRQCYLNAFARQNLESTISAAVEYVHVKVPLTRILGDAHHLLDDIAKEERGRDAIAVRVWKPGGQALEWAMPWIKALTPHSPAEHSLKIEKLAQFTRDDAAVKDKEAVRFSSKFFYKIRERFDLLNPVKDKKEQWGNESIIFNENDAATLLAVDYLASGINEGRRDKLKIKDAEALIQPLLEQCRPVTRHKHEGVVNFSVSNRLEADGALLVRFLACKGVER